MVWKERFIRVEVLFYILLCRFDSDNKQMKGKNGKIIEKFILKDYFDVEINPNSEVYDLPYTLNKLTNKNVSIKSTSSNTISCSDVFNFLGSDNLELFIVCYIKTNSGIKIKKCYVFLNTVLLFKKLNLEVDKVLLFKLKNYVYNLSYPFTKEQRLFAINLARTIDSKSLLTINVKLSSTNKRIQCSLSLEKLIVLYSYKVVYKNYIIYSLH